MFKKMMRLYLVRYGQKLMEQRKRTGLLQREVAEDIGISQSIISHIECGRYLPSEHLERKLLNEYGIDERKLK